MGCIGRARITLWLFFVRGWNYSSCRGKRGKLRKAFASGREGMEESVES
jgi:hypothetical protein